MRKLYLILLPLLLLLINEAQTSHNCTHYDDETHGVGCHINNLTTELELHDILLDEKVPETSITWVMISDSHMETFPKDIFKKFVNMKSIFISDCTGLQSLQDSYFDEKLVYIMMDGNDIHNLSRNTFAGLTNVNELYLQKNKIKWIDKHAFKDLTELLYFGINNNLISEIDDELLVNNVNLITIDLQDNRLKVITAKLFAQNKDLKSINLKNNLIIRIEKGFIDDLKSLTSINLSLNFCISEEINVTASSKWTDEFNKFRSCFSNFAQTQASQELAESIKDEIRALGPISHTEELRTEPASGNSTLIYCLLVIIIVCLTSVLIVMNLKRLKIFPELRYRDLLKATDDC